MPDTACRAPSGRAGLEVELPAAGDARAGPLGLGRDARVHVDIVALAGGARAAVRDIDLGAPDLGNARAILRIARDAAGRITGRRDAGLDRREIDAMDPAGVLGAGIRRHDLRPQLIDRYAG